MTCPTILKFEITDLACPYFMPLERIENGAWLHPSRLPLGAGWKGHCTAPGHETEVPSQDVVESFCNLGYDSGCGWAPRDRAWDAVRFAVVAPVGMEKRRSQNSNSAPRTILLQFACEREHRPVSHGELEYDFARAQWLRWHDNPRVQKMAQCFLDSYLQKKPEKRAEPTFAD
jgi:hypothetical protein